MEAERYFLDQDQSSHWYVVPLSRQEEWQAWCNLDEDDEASWDEPEYAVRVGGAYTLVTFTDPKVG